MVSPAALPSQAPLMHWPIPRFVPFTSFWSRTICRTRRSPSSRKGCARSRRESTTHRLLGELNGTLAALDSARRTESLLASQLLPQTELGLRSALAAYENGKVDFATLLDAQRQIRKARQDRLKAQVEAQLRLAEVERIVGEDL